MGLKPSWIGTLLHGTNVRLNWNIESDMKVYWIKFKNTVITLKMSFK